MISSLFRRFESHFKVSQRIEALRIYGRRSIMWFWTNKPCLSGDGFLSISNQIVRGPKFWSLIHLFRSSKIPHVTFLPTHVVREDRFQDLISPFCRILILGNSDYDLTKKDVEDLSRLKLKIYAQNLEHRASNFHVLPIGLENRRLGVNGLKRYYKQSFSKTPKQDKVLIGPFSMTHPERLDLLGLKSEKGPWDFLEGRMKLAEYSKISSSYKFVACPRGNGLDTHRFWETLYRGSVPIVLSSNWSKMIQELGIPLLIVENWSAETLRKTVADNLDFEIPEKIPALWMKFWRTEFVTVD